MNLRTRLRRPTPSDLVTVAVTGAPTAVTALARVLAATVVVHGMSHTPTTDTSAITLTVTCTAPTIRRAA